MKSKKLLTLVAVIIAVLAPGVANASVTYSATQWPPSWNNGVDMSKVPLSHYAFDIVDTFNNGSTDVSFIRVAVPGMQPFCSSLSDPACADLAKKYGWWIIRLLPPCDDANQRTECIESLNITASDGKSVDYIHVGSYARTTFLADPANGLGVGAGSSMWVDPRNPDSGKGYLVTVSGDAGASYGSKSFPLTTFDATVTPYRTVSGNYAPMTYSIANKEISWNPQSGTSAPSECIWILTGKCGITSEFEENVKIKFVLHLPSTLSRWVVGRLANPDLNIQTIGEANGVSYERLIVDASPIAVPMIGGMVSVETAPDAVKAEWARNGCTTCSRGIWAVNVESSNEGAFHMMDIFKPVLGDKSMVTVKYFSISSMQASEQNLRRCDRKGSISGLVATNASAYVGAPPLFDGTSLNYKVGAMHYTSDGEVFKGVYDLLMPEETAKCLYGFSDAPISATVSVTSESGVNSVATSVLKKSDGWIHLNASGFTFSNPTIKVKLNGTKTASSSGTVPAQTVNGPTIQWCAKGYAKKKVFGTNPVCPKGYKKIAGPTIR